MPVHVAPQTLNDSWLVVWKAIFFPLTYASAWKCFGEYTSWKEFQVYTGISISLSVKFVLIYKPHVRTSVHIDSLCNGTWGLGPLEGYSNQILFIGFSWFFTLYQATSVLVMSNDFIGSVPTLNTQINSIENILAIEDLF